MVNKKASGFERRIYKGLERSYLRAKSQGHVVNVDEGKDKFIIFSDQHRGKKDGADDFKRCEKAYRDALKYYLLSGHTLVVLGDAEDLWECTPKQVMDSYKLTMLLEAEFDKRKRYFKIYGNHDDYWERISGIKKYLQPIFKRTISIRENLVLRFYQGGGPVKEVFLVHGHQGDPISDKSRKIAKFLVHTFWRPFQRFTNIKLTTPAYDHELRSRHDIAMYSWANTKKGLVLIAGHTHHPVFESMDHLGRIDKELKMMGSVSGTNMKQKEAELRKRREVLLKKAGHAFTMQKPCYFNSGCCSFSDGDVTGIEISDGYIRLVKWPNDGGKPNAKVLQESILKNVFSAL